MSPEKKGNRRDWTPREMRLASEFVSKFYPEAETRFHVRLGSLPARWKGRFVSDKEERLMGVFRRWADAVVILPDRIVLIEAKILPKPGVGEQLDLYERLIPETPELRQHAHKPIEKVLVCAIEDRLVTQLLRERGIRVVVYKPAWIDEYLDLVEARERSPGVQTLED